MYILHQNQNLQSQQIQDEFALIYLNRVELGDHWKLLHTLDFTLFLLQHIYIYRDKVTYLER